MHTSAWRTCAWMMHLNRGQMPRRREACAIVADGDALHLADVLATHDEHVLLVALKVVASALEHRRSHASGRALQADGHVCVCA